MAKKKRIKKLKPAPKKSKFTRVCVLETTGNVVMKDSNVFLDITRDKDDVDYWVDRLKKIKRDFTLVLADGTTNTPPFRELSFIRGYVIYTKRGCVDDGQTHVESGHETDESEVDDLEFV